MRRQLEERTRRSMIKLRSARATPNGAAWIRFIEGVGHACAGVSGSLCRVALHARAGVGIRLICRRPRVLAMPQNQNGSDTCDDQQHKCHNEARFTQVRNPFDVNAQVDLSPTILNQCIAISLFAVQFAAALKGRD